jgi:hypothetical protein
MFEKMGYFEVAEKISKDFNVDTVVQFSHGHIFSIGVKHPCSVEAANGIFKLVDFLKANNKKTFVNGDTTGYVLNDDVLFFITGELIEDAKTTINLLS